MSSQGRMEFPGTGQYRLPMTCSLLVGWNEHRDDGPFELPSLTPTCRFAGHGSRCVAQAHLGGPAPFTSFRRLGNVG